MILYIIYTKTDYYDYILEGLNERRGICLIEVSRSQISFTLKIIRKIFSFFNLSHMFPKLYFNKSFLNEISKIKIKDKILFQTNPDLNELKTITNQLPDKIVKHLWLWNPLNKEYRKKSPEEIKNLIKKFRGLGFCIETFDKFDSDFYKIKLRNQFYRFPFLKGEKIEVKYNFYFLGFAKDREKEINWLIEQFKTLQLSFKFHIIKDKQDALSYAENVKNILKTECIVDINQKKQTGITLRPLEAIFFNKKLITDNKNILNHDFYHSNNIFVLGKDKLSELPQFLKKDKIIISSKILKNYDINGWLNYYL